MDEKTQLEMFNQAVELLGGQRAAAQLLGMTERSMRYLVAGTRRLHDGILRDLCNAMILRAACLRGLEQQLNPAFTRNRTPLQDVPLHTDPKRWNGGAAVAGRED